eukprot:TRINITY_DN1851_c0_g1_i1.p1 TRINITY_DN1851_c0_g1~~TRINITY_DN1851_c0_g1_i1.p1  ORF type:complete len:250 (-),score=43.53 TRINITY_DN1851_c0_g1_i1:87-836(-)
MALQGAGCYMQQDAHEHSRVRQAVIVESLASNQAFGEATQGSLPASFLKIAQTPGVQASSNTTTPPGAPGCSSSESSALLRGLRRDSLKEVKAALEYEPDAAVYPILEARFEPPLCCAVRLGCSEHIVQLLLQHGAIVDVEDADRYTPLMLLSMQPSFLMPSFFDFADEEGHARQQWSLNVAKLLIDAGADPLSSAGCGFPSAVQLAEQLGNSHLVRFYSGEPNADAHADGGAASSMAGLFENPNWPSF